MELVTHWYHVVGTAFNFRFDAVFYVAILAPYFRINYSRVLLPGSVPRTLQPLVCDKFRKVDKSGIPFNRRCLYNLKFYFSATHSFSEADLRLHWYSITKLATKNAKSVL